MAEDPIRARVIAELTAAGDHRHGSDPGFEAFQTCPKLQRASEALGIAVQRSVSPLYAGAFNARTFTPLDAPPGWLPPPI